MPGDPDGLVDGELYGLAPLRAPSLRRSTCCVTGSGLTVGDLGLGLLCSTPLGLSFGVAFSPLRTAISSRNYWMSSACRRCCSSTRLIRARNTSPICLGSDSSSTGSRFASAMLDRWGVQGRELVLTRTLFR